MAVPLIGMLGKLSAGIASNTAKLGTLGEIFTDVIKLQTASARVGRDMTAVMGKVSALSKDLPVGIAFETEAAIAAFDAGFKNYNKGINKLFTQMKLTGQNTDAMLRGLRNLQVTTGLSNDAVGSLASQTIELSEVYGISSENLTKAMGALSRSLEENATVQLLQGQQGGALEKAMNEVGAVLGEGFGPQLQQFTKLLVGGENFQLRSIAGLGDIAAKIAAGTITAQDIMQAMRRTEQFTKQVLGPGAAAGEAASRNVELMTEGVFQGNKAFAGSLVLTKELNRKLAALGDAANLAAGNRKGFMETLQALGSKTLDPWKQIFIANFDKFMAVLKPIFNIVAQIGKWLIPKVGSFIDFMFVIQNQLMFMLKPLHPLILQMWEGFGIAYNWLKGILLKMVVVFDDLRQAMTFGIAQQSPMAAAAMRELAEMELRKKGYKVDQDAADFLQQVAEEGVMIKPSPDVSLGASNDALAMAIAGIVQEPFSEIVAMNEAVVGAIEEQTGAVVGATEEVGDQIGSGGGSGPSQALGGK